MDTLRRTSIIRIVPTLDFGGVESALAVHAQFHDRQRFSLRVCTFWKAGRAAREIENFGVPVDVLGIDPAVRNPRATLGLARYMRMQRPDLLHASVPEADFHAGVLATLLPQTCPIITDEAGMPNRSLPKRLVSAALHRHASGIVAVSSALKDYLLDREFVALTKVRVIPTCGNPAFFNSAKPAYAIDGRPFRIVAVGRLVPIKNHSVLLHALSLVRRRGANVELRICGAGPLENALKAEARDLGLETAVRIDGYVEDLLTALHRADAFALPSHSEGCSLSLIEGMASGLPVIASDVPGNREVLAGYDDRWLLGPNRVDHWEAAIAVLANMPEEDRKALGTRARELAFKRFSPTAHVTALENFYETVLERARKKKVPRRGPLHARETTGIGAQQ